MQPASACAPGYRSNSETHRNWSEAGVRVVQNGTGSGLKAPHMDEFGLLHLYRTIDFEPSQRELDIEKYLQIAGNCFSRGLPVIISIHSINFHSSLKDFRNSTLAVFDLLLTALESKYPELLYVNDEDLYAIATQGAFRSCDKKIAVSAAHHQWKARVAYQGVL
jgi:hypothetical protein